jgi:peptidoglycan hydrolase-like protein with peptidoglycan-binding domain
MARVAALQAQLPTLAKCIFSRPLALGARGEDVRCLQRFLNASGFSISVSGPGSLGNETTYFGSLTRGAVSAWQNRYAVYVLAPLGLTSGTGFWGRFSIAYYGVIHGGPL